MAHWFVTLSVVLAFATLSAVVSTVPSRCAEDEVSLLQAMAKPVSRQQSLLQMTDDDEMKPWACNKCSSYPNIIRLGGRGRAGLDDRLTDLITWAGLAQKLCARLQVRPPCEKLLKYLNGKMSREVPWSKYIDLVAEDGSDMLQAPDSNENDRIVMPKKLESGKQEPIEDTFDAASKALADGKPFDWTVDYDWLSVPWAKPQQFAFLTIGVLKYHIDCRSFQMHASKEVTQAVASVRNKLGLAPQSYMALHIRRGDAHKACDTSVKQVADYVSCSLKKSPDTSSHPIMLFTDDRDPTYVQTLLGSLQEASGGSRKVIDGERAIEDALGTQVTDVLNGGSTFQYMTTLLMRYEASIELLMDRAHCLECEDETKPQVLCDSEMGKCELVEYFVSPQFDTSMEAMMISATVNSKADPDPACPQKTFPALDMVSSDMVGFVVKKGEEDPFKLPLTAPALGSSSEEEE